MFLKDKVGDWLQVFKAQTAPATIILVLVPYLVGGGNLFTFDALFIGIFALLCHWFSFGHNSLMDTVSGYDLRDKHKAHYSLVRGAIRLESGHKVIHSGLFIITLVGIWLAFKGNGNFSLAVVWFTIFITAGHAYNDGLSKVTIWSSVPATIYFTSFAIFGFYLAASEMNDLMIYVALYFAVTYVFQISFSGELQDIKEEESNLLRFMGARVYRDRLELCKAKYYAWGVKLINIGVGCYIIYHFGFNPLSLSLFALLAALALYLCYELARNRIWDRNKLRIHIALEEIATFYILLTILIPITGLAASATLMFFGIIYLLICNFILWGTILPPQGVFI